MRIISRDVKLQGLTIMTILTLCSIMAFAKSNPKVKSALKEWPQEIQTIQYPASIDKSQQPMLMYTAKCKEQRPLLVGLHTWSGGYNQVGGEIVYARWCIEKDWHFIHPHFRGPNWTPDACGSALGRKVGCMSATRAFEGLRIVFAS